MTQSSDILTPRQRRIMALAAAGMANKEIARLLGIRPNTVRHHLNRTYARLGARSRTHALYLLLKGG